MTDPAHTQAAGDSSLTDGSLHRAIRILAIPMVLEMAMESVFAVADIYFVGRISSDAVAAVGITETLLWVVYSIGFGLEIAVTAMVARRMGERKPGEAARSAVQGNWLGLLVSLPVALVGVLFAAPLLRAMGATNELAAYGSTYLAIAFGGNAVILLLFINNAVFRGAGDARLAMWSLWIANGANLILDPCLIFGLGPFPELGLMGAAIATVIGRGIGVVYQYAMLFAGPGRLRLRFGGLGIDGPLMARLGRLSMGAVTQALVENMSWIVLVRMVALFGSAAMAGYTIGMRVLVFAFLPAYGLANAAATLVGQNLGAKKPERAEKSVSLTCAYAGGALFLVMLLLIPTARPLVELFTDDAAVVDYAEQCLRILSYGYVFFAVSMTMTQALNGAGDTVTPMWINISVLWFVKLPLAYLLAHPFGLGPQGVFIAVTAAYGLHAIVAFTVFRQGRWKLREV